MAIIRDMIPAFQLFQPTSAEDAIELLIEHGDDGWVLAGGMDSFDWWKERVITPTAVVDLVNVDELKGVRVTADGVEIGAMTTLTEVANHPELLANYSVLTDAAIQIATPQIRNRGTIAGNLAQDTRCWYYRGGWPCYRAGGNTCYASAPTAMTREHAIRIPSTWAGATFYYEKVEDRKAWDFALMTVASAMRISGGVIQEVRMAANGAAPYPMRLQDSERIVQGQAPSEALGLEAGEAAIRDAQPLRHNDYKVPLLRNLVRRAVRASVA